MKKIYHAFFIKNLTTFVIPMLIPLVVLGSLSTILIQQYVTNRINEDNLNVLKQTKENMELIFNELDSLNLYVVASATQFINFKKMLNKDYLDRNDSRNLASLKNFIDSPNIARPYIDSIYLYLNNGKGQFLTSTTGGLVSLNDFYDRNWFNTFKLHPNKGNIWAEARTITKQYPGFPEENVNLITMFRRITGENDGVIVLNINSDYIEKHLNSLSTTNGQVFLVIDKNGKIIFKNHENKLKDIDNEKLISQQKSSFSIKFGKDSYIVTKIFSDKYGWTYISITPKSDLYQVPIKLSKITILLLIISIISGTVLAYYLTRKNYQDMKTIITILQVAEAGQPLPPVPSKGKKNVYSYIIHTILKNFMEHNYLKVQLSERKYKAQAMEFAALQSQLNPHFLFNTLETLNWKAIRLTGRPNELNEMVENLADILRYSLDGENKMVHLKEEITYTNSYIKIQKMRFKDKFEVIWDYHEEDLKYHVIKLILQPLLENSLSHGISEDRNCLIKIKIRVSSTLLKISVIDNGDGISPQKLEEIRSRLNSNQEQSKHIGLVNTHRRLKVTYGEPYGIIIKSKKNWGTVVHLTIPK
ncbi:sensor histidine kinase [Bacillus sp. UNC438CL73TsuS30]|uniref:sensor histidine kinase n=1 Tax=Bacillus sp. UNC438CL73TsuS30 TaxID=1340434 RepID=UPI00047BD6B4|nr:sensor histidine kinase [Bacillus sp. UNC438CL73TsuS30]